MIKDTFKSIPWDCSLYTKYNKQNLGCKQAVVSAIDWFFSQVEHGLYLKTIACLLSSFWPLPIFSAHFRDNKNIWAISGYSIFNSFTPLNSYYYSRWFGVWGWASWRDRWASMTLLLF